MLRCRANKSSVISKMRLDVGRLCLEKYDTRYHRESFANVRSHLQLVAPAELTFVLLF